VRCAQEFPWAHPACRYKLPPCLRTDSPAVLCAYRGTLLHVGLQACSHLNKCYYHQDPHCRPLHAGLPLRSPTARTVPPTHRDSLHPGGTASAACWSAIHFRGRYIRQVSCYTLLSGFRLPGPPPCCVDASTPFLGSASHALGRLVRAFGSSPIAIPAYQVWPTRALLYFSTCNQTMLFCGARPFAV